MIFQGNCPRNPFTTGKYHLRQVNGLWTIQSDFRIGSETIRSVSTGHIPLVNMLINGRRQSGGGSPGGAFYINEFSQVLIPDRSSPHYYLVGEYDALLKFEVEGNSISADGSGSLTKPLVIGDEWTGPRHGIPYNLSLSNGSPGIRYERKVNERDTDTIELKEYCSSNRINDLSS